MRLLSAALSALAVSFLATSGAHADDACTRIHEPIVTTFTDCGFPGICTTGTVGPPDLHWTSSFVVLSMALGAHNSTLYTGRFVLTTPKGTVTLRDSGILTAKGRFFEIQHVVSGTDAFEGATGLLTSQGFATASGFAGRLNGRICVGEAEHSEDGESSDFDGEDSDE
jgi:hypothetical protein